MDLEDGITTNGNKVQIWRCTDNDSSQIWTLWMHLLQARLIIPVLAFPISQVLCFSSILCTIFFRDESFRYNFAINCEGIGNACKAALVGAANLRQGRPALNVAVKFVFADSKEFSKYITITILYFSVVFRLRFVGRRVTGITGLLPQE